MTFQILSYFAQYNAAIVIILYSWKDKLEKLGWFTSFRVSCENSKIFYALKNFKYLLAWQMMLVLTYGIIFYLNTFIFIQIFNFIRYIFRKLDRKSEPNNETEFSCFWYWMLISKDIDLKMIEVKNLILFSSTYIIRKSFFCWIFWMGFRNWFFANNKEAK